ncbi:FkbM family methyltransferase [bacterium]|nr:FkbM family methyltransferase [bacterium]
MNQYRLVDARAPGDRVRSARFVVVVEYVVGRAVLNDACRDDAAHRDTGEHRLHEHLVSGVPVEGGDDVLDGFDHGAFARAVDVQQRSIAAGVGVLGSVLCGRAAADDHTHRPEAGRETLENAPGIAPPFRHTEVHRFEDRGARDPRSQGLQGFGFRPEPEAGPPGRRRGGYHALTQVPSAVTVPLLARFTPASSTIGTGPYHSEVVDDRLYRVGAAAIRLAQRLGPASRPIGLLSSVWQRYARVRSLLSRFAFDGVVDGGANVGEFAHLVRQTLPKADLVCVEPHPRCATILRRKGFRVVEAALWREPGRLRLSQPLSATTSCTVVGGAMADGPRVPAWDVEAVRLDDLALTGNDILVKLDVQGAELAALEGLGTLWERCSALLLEVSTVSDGTYEPVRALLAERGFREYATIHEFESTDGEVLEADKVFVRRVPR